MTKYNYNSMQDKRFIEQSLDSLITLIFGVNNPEKKAEFMELFQEKVKEVNVFPQGTVTPYLSFKIPGICRLDENVDKLIIEMLGYINANRNQYAFIEHEGVHEFCHAFADLLPLLYSSNPNGIIKNNIYYKNHMGMISEIDPRNGDFFKRHLYGKMVNETMMDIISTMAINASNPTSTLTIDDILHKQYEQWQGAKTSYSIFTSITRLIIAAFSNDGSVNYQRLYNRGNGIFDVDTILNDGKKYKINDFLYGILFDQLHIEHEFDKYMGQGYYKEFCKFLDTLFIVSLDSQNISSEAVKAIMKVLPEFLNKKMAYYIKNNIISQDKANQIVINFNKIWNEMIKEYSTLFSEEDIEKIRRDAAKNY